VRPIPLFFLKSLCLLICCIVPESHDSFLSSKEASSGVSRDFNSQFLTYCSSRHRLTVEDTEKSSHDQSEVYAQLEPLRSPGLSDSMTADSTISATIREWNDNFFQPRGVHIIASKNINTFSSIGGHQAPPYFNEPTSNSHTVPQAGFSDVSNTARLGRKGMFDGFKPFSSREANSRGFRLGPVVADTDGFRIGKDIVVSQASSYRTVSRPFSFLS
jgi:hypothetical protein